MVPKTPSESRTPTLEITPPTASPQSLVKRLLAADTKPDTLRIRFMAGR